MILTTVLEEDPPWVVLGDQTRHHPFDELHEQKFTVLKIEEKGQYSVHMKLTWLVNSSFFSPDRAGGYCRDTVL